MKLNTLIVSPWAPMYYPSQHTGRPSLVTVVRPWQNTAGMRVDLILVEGLPAARREETLLTLRTRLKPGGELLELDEPGEVATC